MKYEAPSLVSHAAAEALTEPEPLTDAIVGLALADPDAAWTTAFLLRMVGHPDRGVRGAAQIGLGHLARRFRRSLPDQAKVRAAIDAGLADADEWVRGQADAASDDFNHFIGRG